MTITNLDHERNQPRPFRRTVRLSGRELEVLTLVAAGHRSQDVGDILFISKRTVDFHLANMYEKFGVSNRMLAVRAAWSLGLLPFEPPLVSHQRY